MLHSQDITHTRHSHKRIAVGRLVALVRNDAVLVFQGCKTRIPINSIQRVVSFNQCKHPKCPKHSATHLDNWQEIHATVDTLSEEEPSLSMTDSSEEDMDTQFDNNAMSLLPPPFPHNPKVCAALKRNIGCIVSLHLRDHC